VVAHTLVCNRHLYLFFGTILMVAIDFISGTLVAHPRPSSPLIHVYMTIIIVPKTSKPDMQSMFLSTNELRTKRLFVPTRHESSTISLEEHCKQIEIE
jgi:hypothetical protein